MIGLEETNFLCFTTKIYLYIFQYIYINKTTNIISTRYDKMIYIYSQFQQYQYVDSRHSNYNHILRIINEKGTRHRVEEVYTLIMNMIEL